MVNAICRLRRLIGPRCSAHVLAVLVLVALVGCREETAGTGAVPIEVTVMQVAPAPVPLTIEQIGQTQASQSVELRARVGGFLIDRPFAEGSHVAKDALLFQIDPDPLKADLEVAEARLEQAKARLARAERDLKRLNELAARQAVSTVELDNAVTDEAAARADVRLYTAQVAKAKLDLSYATIKAPFDGEIGATRIDVGGLVDAAPGGVLARIDQIDPIYVSATVSEREAIILGRDRRTGRVTQAPGESIQVSLKLVDGTPFAETGVIDFVDPQVDPQTGNIRIRAKVPNPDRRLRPGQFVRMTITGLQRANAILVPQSSVLQSPTGPFVYAVGADDTVQPRPVQVGEWQGDNWVVLGGLQAGDRVVTDGMLKVRPGMKVKVGATAPALTAPTAAPSTAPATQPAA